MQYSLPLAYFLWLISGCGALGFHRFYLGKVGTGILWLCSGGLGGIGSLYDAITMPRQVREANIRAQVRETIEYRTMEALSAPVSSAPKPESAEKTILRVAKKNGGFVSPGEVALEGDVSVDQARKALEKLAASGSVEMRVRSSGVVVFFFPEFASETGEDFAL